MKKTLILLLAATVTFSLVPSCDDEDDIVQEEVVSPDEPETPDESETPDGTGTTDGTETTDGTGDGTEEEGANPDGTGIRTAEGLIAFAAAVNGGLDIDDFMVDGEVLLMDDIDMSGVDWSDYMIGGTVTPSTTTANSFVSYIFGGNVFGGTFNGDGYSLKNIDWTFDLDGDNIAYGLFSGLAGSGVIKDLTLEGRITVTGTARQGSSIGALVGYAEGTVTNVTNRCNMNFAGTDASDIAVYMGGIVGTAMNGASVSSCVNESDLICTGSMDNISNGNNSGFHNGGICGYMSGTATIISDCTNNGDVSAPSGRTGGLVGLVYSGTLQDSVNNGLIQDDVNLIYVSDYGYKRLGGIVGNMGSSGKLTGCTNNGNVFSQLGCHTGGFVGYNEGTVTGCENRGVILSDWRDENGTYYGPGWACGYNATTQKLSDCVKGGKVGDYTEYKDNPESTPDATYDNAVCQGNFDPWSNGMSYSDLYVPDEIGENQIKVISFNVRTSTADSGEHAWSNRRDACCALLYKENPTIFGVQEARSEQMDYLKEHLDYTGIGVGRDDGVSAGEFMGIFYNSSIMILEDWGTFWLSETPDTPSMGFGGD